MARNVLRNWERSGRRHIRLVAKVGSSAENGGEDPDVQIVVREEHREILDAIATLAHVDQEVIRLKLWEGLSNAQVGAVLGMTDGAAEARYAEAVELWERYAAEFVEFVGSSRASETELGGDQNRVD